MIAYGWIYLIHIEAIIAKKIVKDLTETNKEQVQAIYMVRNKINQINIDKRYNLKVRNMS